MTDTTLRIERMIDASPARVFAAWTTRAAMEAWYKDGDGYVARVLELDVRVGGRYRVEFGPPDQPPFVETGEYLEITPSSRLVMTETLTAGDETMWTDTTVTVELYDENGKTRCVLTHAGFPSRERRDDAQGGWPGFLERLERLLTQQ
jgi:uncharacterized protein YndB with AHSA1/START domain